MQASELFFRCHSLGHIMGDAETITEKQLTTIRDFEAKKATPKGLTDIQAKELERLIAKRDSPPQLPDTCITHLLDLFGSHKYSRRERKEGKFLDKGNEREEDSITLVSRVTGKFFEKNSVRLRDGFIQGEPDLFEGESIDKAEHIRDTKTSWSLNTFLRAKYKPLDPLYKWQGHGYMRLTGAKTHTVDFCLVNGTAEAILAEKRLLQFRYKDPTSTEYKLRAQEIERNHIFDLQAFIREYPGFPFDTNIDGWVYDIPFQDRHFCFTFERDEEAIKKIPNRVTECREWMETNLYSKCSDYVPEDAT